MLASRRHLIYCVLAPCLLAVLPSFGAGDSPLVTADASDGEAASAAPTHDGGPGNAALLSAADIRAALARPVSPQFDDVELKDAMAWFSQELGIAIEVDWNDVLDAGFDRDTKVELRLGPLPARSALNLVLRPLEMRVAVDDGSLRVVSREHVDDVNRLRTYDVTDLVGFESVNRVEFPRSPRDLIDLLMDLLPADRSQSSAEWNVNGGAGRIRSFSSQGNCLLLIRQIEPVHEEIEQLLGELRRNRRALPSVRRTSVAGSSGQPPSSTSAATRPSERPGLPPTELVEGNNQFGIELFRGLTTDHAGNVLFSPYSVASTLAMAHRGARGETADEMARALQLRLPGGSIPAAFAQLDRVLRYAADTGGCELRVANRFWGKAGFAFHEQYLNELRGQYGAELAQIRFLPATAAAKRINDWATRQTAGKIKHLVAPGDFNAATRLVLANAVYFKGSWERPFKWSQTRPLDFEVGDKQVKVPTMSLEAKFGHLPIEGAHLLELVYAGGDFSMLLLLPEKKPGAMAELVGRLSADALADWVSRLKQETVDVRLPRFAFDSKYQLKEPLQKLGMRKAFDIRSADFSGMASNLALDKVIHKAYIKVDEQGSEVAGATALEGFFGAGPPKNPEFHVDRPFLFLIRDRHSGSILFLGQVADPSARAGD